KHVGFPSSGILSVDAEWQGEADIAFDHVAHIGQAVAELQSAFDAHAKGKALVLFWVDTDRAQDIRVNHAAAAPFDPASARALIREPHITRGGWLSECEGVRAHTRRGLWAKELARDVVRGTQQVRHGEILLDGKAFKLLQDRSMRSIQRIGAE